MSGETKRRKFRSATEKRKSTKGDDDDENDWDVALRRYETLG